MTEPVYEVIAVRYAHRDWAKRGDNFLDPVDDPERPMPMDYFTWLVRDADRTVLVDTGFRSEAAGKRNRTFFRTPADGLREIGVDPTSVQDIVITHGHWDHTGTVEHFPGSRVHMQAIEMAFLTGLDFDTYKRSFEIDDTLELVRRRYDGSLTLHDGSFELAGGLSVHHLGGHTPGMQVVRVRTKRGVVVLASDATHYYENMEAERPFVTIHNREKSITAFRMLKELADSPQHVVAGHDPLVMKRYPALSPKHEGVAVRLDVAPTG